MVLVIGELCLDIIVHRPKSVCVLGEPVWAEEVTLTPGGSVFYAGCTFNALGLGVFLRAAVGDDWEGKYLISELSRRGLATGGIMQVKNQSTQKCIASCDGENEHFIACSPPIGGFSQKINLLLPELKLIYIAGYLMYPEMWEDKFASFLSKAKRIGVKIFLDTQCLPISPAKILGALNPDILKNLDALILNSKEAELLTGEKDIKEAAKRLYKLGAAIIVIKLGKKGSLVYEGENLLYSPAFAVKVRNTIGGGDVFGAAFAYGLLQGWTLKKASNFANAAAALSIADRDAGKKIPILNEILEFLVRNGDITKE